MWEYYKDKTILLAGGIEFIGTALLCRILREASPKQIYVLCRRGTQGAHEKWKSLLSEQSAATLLESKKITVINGDISIPKMGLWFDTLEELEQSVNIVIHATSSIDLLGDLGEMSRSVIAPTLELASLALNFQNLERFVYVSTAYCNAHLWTETDATDVPVKEEIYHLENEVELGSQALAAWSEIQETGTSSEYTSHDFPWAYAYAHHLTERLVTDLFASHDAFEKLLIIRPSMIGPAIEYPHPGFSSSSTPLTALAASILLYPGRHMRIAGRAKNPWTETTLDEVPVDVVVDRLLMHLVYGTTGCVHAVSGERGRLPFKTWWASLMAVRRLPWKLKPVWIPLDWHSSGPHPAAGIFKVLGTSFEFAENQTLDLLERIGEKESLGLRLFTPDFESYDFQGRRDGIRQIAIARAKKMKWPRSLIKLLIPGKKVEQYGSTKG
ncbi:hypothetical protein AWENTII_011819 [Aspergillus wentii]|nr:hypothetical protein MW887_006268 [Aspergillus wentii]